MPTATRQPLTDTAVLITRPLAQAKELIRAAEAAGGTPLTLPMLEIVARSDADIAVDASALPEPDIAIFVSPNAVSCGMRFGVAPHIAAIGPATAQAISKSGHTATIVPSTDFDSEGLLQEAELQSVAGKNIRIIRGTLGRELLGDTLRERGARVDYLATYERRSPELTPEAARELADILSRDDLHAVVIMSVETLHNFAACLSNHGLELPANVVLVTPARRVLKEAEKQLPGTHTVLAGNTDAPSIVDAIIGSRRPESGRTP